MHNTKFNELLATSGIYKYDMNMFIAANTDLLVDVLNNVSIDPIDVSVAREFVDQQLRPVPYINDIMRDADTIASIQRDAQQRIKNITISVINVLIEVLILGEDIAIIYDDVVTQRILDVIEKNDVMDIEAIRLLLSSTISSELNKTNMNSTRRMSYNNKKITKYEMSEYVYNTAYKFRSNCIVVANAMRDANGVDRKSKTLLTLLKMIATFSEKYDIHVGKFISTITRMPLGYVSKDTKSVTNEQILVSDMPQKYILSNKSKLAICVVVLGWLVRYRENQFSESDIAPPLEVAMVK